MSCRACPGSASSPPPPSPAMPPGGRKLGLLVGGCFLYIALFGQWTSAMLTLALILDRRAALRRHRRCSSASGPGARRAAERLIVAACPRPDADHPDLRLSHPDAAPVRQQPGLGDDRDRPSSRRRRWCGPPCSACAGAAGDRRFRRRWPGCTGAAEAVAGAAARRRGRR